MHPTKHVNRAKGGRTEMKVSGNPDVFKEAEEKEGAPVKDTKARGGRIKKAAGGKVRASKGTTVLMTGGAVRPRLDRPGRKMGGRVGADRSPLSSAHKGEHAGGIGPNPKDTYGGLRPD